MTLFALTDPRRSELYARAAPLLAQHGYRGATVRDLARACGLSPGGLYHHFASKLDLALYPILGRESCDIGGVLRGVSPDPLVRLVALIDCCIEELPEFLLALRLADEAGSRQRVEAVLARVFQKTVATFAGVARDAATALDFEKSIEFGKGAVAIFLGAAVPGFNNRHGPILRSQVIAFSRSYFVSSGVSATRFEAAMADGAATS